MDNYEYIELLKALNQKIVNIRNIIKPENLEASIKEIEAMEQDENYWNDTKQVTINAQKKKRSENLLNLFTDAKSEVNDAKELFDMANEEKDTETINELFKNANDLEKKIRKIELAVLLSDKDDSKNAIITIHPGAGGTESQDWSSMLYRMYLRWAEKNSYKVDVIDYQAGEEAGIKDVSFIIRGENAFGYLKLESGIHRLVRISPFDSNARRHTSFSSVVVSPEIDEDINIEVEEKDLKIDTYRASGAGGQHVNTTDSAVRITHIPTGIIAQCQNNRSQHKNKEFAMKVLKSKLYELELEKQKQEQNVGEKTEIGWGHQIRSYVLAPYQQVKDVRNGVGYSNVDAILDGDISEIIEDVLISELGNR